jgi:hypothetical protein
MRLISINPESGRAITEFGSQGAVHVPVAKLGSLAQVDCLYLHPGGMVGMHPAVQRQLFMVVQGSGWVRGENTGRISIQAGQAALWEAGELHESGTESGMAAVVLEGERLELYREQA